MRTLHHAAAATIVLCSLVLANAPSNAQYWQAWEQPSAYGAQVSFGHDEKNVFFVSNDGGAQNIFRVPIKGGTPVAVTKFTEGKLLNTVHFLNRPMLAFMRAAATGPGDLHIYRINDDGTGELDLTPTGAGVKNVIIGLSFNGRYVYYTSNKVSLDKTDVYRYDTQQNISELVFPNDKDYRAVAWSRDHAKVMLEDPSTKDLSIFDINTTEKISVGPGFDSKELSAFLPLAAAKSWSIAPGTTGISYKSGSVEAGREDVIFSVNGRFARVSGKWIDSSTGAALEIPAEPPVVAIAPRETLLLMLGQSTDGSPQDLILYDLTKKSTTPLAKIATVISD